MVQIYYQSDKHNILTIKVNVIVQSSNKEKQCNHLIVEKKIALRTFKEIIYKNKRTNDNWTKKTNKYSVMLYTMVLLF